MTFTPFDSTDYASVTTTVNVNVNKATPVLTVNGTNALYNGSADPATALITGVNGVPGSTLEGVSPTLTYFAGSPAIGQALSGPPTAAGSYTVFATFPGSADYLSTSASLTIDETSLPSGTIYPQTLAATPDGSIWISDYSSAWIGQITQLTPSGGFVTYNLPSGSSSVGGMIAGPNGDIWFTTGANDVDTITSSGIEQYALPSGSTYPYGLVDGPDGNVWFENSVSSGGMQIGRITPGGVVTEFSLAASSAGNLVAGPDGNLWFTDYSTGKIGQITPAGTITEFPLPSGYQYPSSLAAGADGNVWFIDDSSSWAETIAEITPTGQVSEHPSSGYTYPSSLVAGADGNMWFTNENSSGPAQIGRITPSGTVTEFNVLSGSSYVGSMYGGLTVGPDGNLWFIDGAANEIGQVTPAGVVSEYSIPSANAYPQNLIVSPDGNLWFPEGSNGKLGMVSIGAAPATFTISQPPVITEQPGDTWASNLVATVPSNAVAREPELSMAA